MSDSQTPETKPGPPNPQAEGVEAASPPGGPLRQDGPTDVPSESDGHEAQGHDDDASANPAANKDAEEAGGHTIPVEDEQPDPQPESGPDSGPAQAGDTLQFENAETSLDQPSEG